MSSFAKPCAHPGCRNKAARGMSYCEGHAPAPRDVLQPYRAAYVDAEYRRNRLARYELAGHRCEECGTPVGKGEWECDHEIEASEWRGPGSVNQIGNLRIRCILFPNRCHYRKTRDSRRARRNRTR